jgi:hypothetical protein
VNTMAVGFPSASMPTKVILAFCPSLWKFIVRLFGAGPTLYFDFERSGQKILEGGKIGALELMMLAEKLNSVFFGRSVADWPQRKERIEGEER